MSKQRFVQVRLARQETSGIRAALVGFDFSGDGYVWAHRLDGGAVPWTVDGPYYISDLALLNVSVDPEPLPFDHPTYTAAIEACESHEGRWRERLMEMDRERRGKRAREEKERKAREVWTAWEGEWGTRLPEALLRMRGLTDEQLAALAVNGTWSPPDGDALRQVAKERRITGPNCPYRTLKGARADGWKELMRWQYGGWRMLLKGHLLAQDADEAMYKTVWRREHGLLPLPGAEPHLFKAARVPPQGCFHYAVYRRDQVFPAGAVRLYTRLVAAGKLKGWDVTPRDMSEFLILCDWLEERDVPEVERIRELLQEELVKAVAG